jgi:hypothetical protein
VIRAFSFRERVKTRLRRVVDALGVFNWLHWMWARCGRWLAAASLTSYGVRSTSALHVGWAGAITIMGEREPKDYYIPIGDGESGLEKIEIFVRTFFVCL